MKVVPGDVVTTTGGWSISKFNRTMHALGERIGDNLLVVAVREYSDDVELCVLSPRLGPVWVHNDHRFVSIVR